MIKKEFYCFNILFWNYLSLLIDFGHSFGILKLGFLFISLIIDRHIIGWCRRMRFYTFKLSWTTPRRIKALIKSDITSLYILVYDSVLFGLRPQTQPIKSFHFGVPIWPLFLWWFPIFLFYNYALYCKCWEPPILTSGMFTSDRVFPWLHVIPVLYRTENCNNKSISCNPIRVKRIKVSESHHIFLWKLGTAVYYSTSLII